eukprot:3205787-Amphidinium_carterae.2
MQYLTRSLIDSLDNDDAVGASATAAELHASPLASALLNATQPVDVEVAMDEPELVPCKLYGSSAFSRHSLLGPAPLN